MDTTDRPHRGLCTDTAPQDQPKGTYTFALNAVHGAALGDANLLANEPGNTPCGHMAKGYVPIGSADMADGETLVFLVSEDGLTSEIGLLDRDCGYATLVNDSASALAHRLGFRADRPVQAVFRLRRGCHRTVYFTDGHNRPRCFDLDSPDDFRNPDGTWNGRLFALQRAHSKVPEFLSVEVADTGGGLLPGGYNVAVQYVDAGMNATEWITASPVVQVYHDQATKRYTEVAGSTGLRTDYTNGRPTGKSIRVALGNLDRSFPYYRLAFIEATSGEGRVTAVRVTEPIPTANGSFAYTGANAPSAATEEELLHFTDTIESAGTLAVLDDRLHLGNTRGKQANLCKLQRYASRIKADCVTKRVSLSDMLADRGNPRSPEHEMHGLGYMPGEVYSFGIVYLFADGTQSPVYHIPGKSPAADPKAVFGPGESTYPMSADNATDTLYAGNASCGGGGYWGRDSEGIPLESAPVRHHRFPLRSEIGLPLVESEMGNEQDVTFAQVLADITGKLRVPVPCPDGDPGCGTDARPTFSIRVGFTVGGEAKTLTRQVNPAQHSDPDGDPVSEVEITASSPYQNSTDITVTSISISDANGDFHELASGASASYNGEHGDYFEGEATIAARVESSTEKVRGRKHGTEVLGIRFSGIDLPLPDDIGGEEVVGYHIVRNERGEHDRTVLDSGVLVPSVVNKKYVSHGLLAPEVGADRLSVHTWGIVHPEHKFHDRWCTDYDELVQEGEFAVVQRNYGKVTYDDVTDGTSYDEGAHGKKSWNDDSYPSDGSPNSMGLDGWSLDVISRDNIVEFQKAGNAFSIPSGEIADRFYLDALESRTAHEGTVDVYNIAADNRVGIVQLTDEGSGRVSPSGDRLPYVVMRKRNANAYSTFRTLPYYRQAANPVLFGGGTASATSVFGGDSYVSPMRYVNTVFWDNRVAYREKKKSWWKPLLGGFLFVFGAVMAFATGGASLLLVGTGLGIMGAGALMLNSGIKLANMQKAYAEAYAAGLRETAFDHFTGSLYTYQDNPLTYGYFGFDDSHKNNGHRGKDGPSDDTIQWIGDCLTDLWFETTVNTNQRYRVDSVDTPSFLASPWDIEEGNHDKFQTIRGENKVQYINSNNNPLRHARSALEVHLVKKLLAFDENRDDNRYYLGVALGEMYAVNPDYGRGNRQKVHFHLPVEYDCCSDCREAFPHRWHWSERSFQEDLSDSFRTFLPNSYKDVPGEAGEIVNMFAMGQNLFLHAREALWAQPVGDRQQVAGDIVSHIGTGELGSLPVRRVGHGGGGLSHRQGQLLTDRGYFFVSEMDGRVYRFAGEGLEDVSALGMSRWFRENIPVLCDTEYRRANGMPYPYRDAPSTPYGTGFLLGRDRLLDRLLVTKRDHVPNRAIIGGGGMVHVCNGQMVRFPDYRQVLEQRRADGWEFLGIEGCRLKFGRTGTETVEETREVTTTGTIPSDADIHVFLDDSGSFGAKGGPWMTSIRNAVDEWVAGFTSTNPNWTGTLYPYYYDHLETWLDYPRQVALAYGNEISEKNVIIVSFCNESDPRYHGSGTDFVPTSPTGLFMSHYDTFVNTIFPLFKSFAGILYPIVTSPVPTFKNFPFHALAAYYGTEPTSEELTEMGVWESPNPAYSAQDWQDYVLGLQTSNPYPDDGLRNYNWAVKHDRARKADNTIISAEEFAADIEHLLQTIESTTTETKTVEVERDVTVYEYVDGVPVQGGAQYNASWTASLSLHGGGMAWASFHSYLPWFYIGRADGMRSWVPRSDHNYSANAMYRHVQKGYYQSFYLKTRPHVIEYVSLPGTAETRVWDSLTLRTRAERRLVHESGYREVHTDPAEVRHETFTRMVVYNSRQCSGWLDLIPVDGNDHEYGPIFGDWMTKLRDGEALPVRRPEGDWHISGFRDIANGHAPIWTADLDKRQAEYYVDKVLVPYALDRDKDWTEMEVFRDRYLVVRLVYHKSDNWPLNCLLTDLTAANTTKSFR